MSSPLRSEKITEQAASRAVSIWGQRGVELRRQGKTARTEARAQAPGARSADRGDGRGRLAALEGTAAPAPLCTGPGLSLRGTCAFSWFLATQQNDGLSDRHALSKSRNP